MLERAADGLLPRRLLLDRAGGRRLAHRLRGDDGGVPRLQQAGRERPLDTAPEWGFDGLAPGDRCWCCAARWLEAHEAGRAPPVVLGATHARALEVVPIEALTAFAAAPDRV